MLYSYSRLKKYEDCPAWWFRSYVLGQKEPPSEALELGKTVHRAIEIIMKSDVNSRHDPELEIIVDDAVQQALREASLPLDAKDVRQLVYQPAVMEYLGTWFVEDHFQIPLSNTGIELQGYIDLWSYDDECPVIVDWKTNKWIYQPTDNHQLGLYALAMAHKIHQVEKRTPACIKCQLVFLRHKGHVEEHIYTFEDMKATRDWAVNIATEIEEKLLQHALGDDPAKLFPAVPSDTCKWCPWGAECLRGLEPENIDVPDIIMTETQAKSLAIKHAQLEKVLREWVEKNGPVSFGNQVYKVVPTTYWRFSPDALKKAIGTIRKQGDDPFRYLTIDNYNINRLKWQEEDLKAFGATSKTYRSLRRVNADS